MGLHVDYAAERMFARIISSLRSARLDAGISQNALSVGLPVRGRAISEWETGAIEPTLGHLIEWSCELGRRLVIVGRDGDLPNGPRSPRPGESWEHFERRRLAVPLRYRRQALGVDQSKLGLLVGVSRDSIQRWELVRVPPRPIAHVVWAQQLGYRLELWPIAAVTNAIKRHRHGLVVPARQAAGKVSIPGDPGRRAGMRELVGTGGGNGS